jgi:hypothetical protein
MPMWDRGVARSEGSDAPSWEYHIERFAADSPAEEEMLRDAKWLNAYGAEGWELANIYRLPKLAYGWRTEWGDALVFCIFKRRVANSHN